MTFEENIASSTVRIVRGCAVMPVPADLDDESVVALQKEVIGFLERHSGTGLLLDFSGVGVMDTAIARAVFDVISMAHYLGVRAVVAGIRPGVASALALLGFDAGDAATAIDIDEGLRLLLRDETGRP